MKEWFLIKPSAGNATYGSCFIYYCGPVLDHLVYNLDYHKRSIICELLLQRFPYQPILKPMWHLPDITGAPSGGSRCWATDVQAQGAHFKALC